MYKDYPDLIALSKNSIHKVEAIGYINQYATEKMVVQLPKGIYQAGEYLQSKADELTLNCCIKLLKTRINLKNRIKSVNCSIFSCGDLSAFVKYIETPYYMSYLCFMLVKMLKMYSKQLVFLVYRKIKKIRITRSFKTSVKIQVLKHVAYSDQLDQMSPF